MGPKGAEKGRNLGEWPDGSLASLSKRRFWLNFGNWQNIFGQKGPKKGILEVGRLAGATAGSKHRLGRIPEAGRRAERVPVPSGRWPQHAAQRSVIRAVLKIGNFWTF